jgi:NADPH:quinone reductase
MQALVYDPDAPHGLRLADTPDPQPGASQVLVEVHATSLLEVR